MTDAPKPTLTEAEREELVESLCGVMHDAYEAAATKAGWETQERSRKPWADVPEANKVTMRAAVSAALDALTFMGWVSPEEAKAREAAARREALLEAEVRYVALKAEALGLASAVQRAKTLAAQWRAEPYPSTADPGWNQGHDMRCESDAYALNCALAEPERDEEGR